MTPARPIRRLAIVNRGEAAVRCIRAVRSLRQSEGSELECLALYTGVDRRAPFVRQADRAVRLVDDAGAVAAYLQQSLSKVKPGDRVLLAYPPGLEMITAFFACIRLGWIPVPVYPPTGHGFDSALANRALWGASDALVPDQPSALSNLQRFADA